VFDIQKTITLVKGALFDAEATWRAYLPDAADWKRTALLITIPVIVAAFALAWVLGLLTSGASLFGIRPTFVGTLINIVSGFIGLMVASYIFSFFAGIFGGRHDFSHGFAALSLISVPVYAGQVVSVLPWIGWLIGLGLFIYGLVLLWQIIPIYLKVTGGKRAVHYIVSLVVTLVAGIVIGMVLGLGQVGPSTGFTTTTTTRPDGSESGAGSGFFGGIMRSAEIVAAAEEDRYEPPANGELTEAQVREFARVMQRFGWVKESLRTAYLQRDINDAVAHNYALFQQYEDELSDFISR
jgi:hypothetical protein